MLRDDISSSCSWKLFPHRRQTHISLGTDNFIISKANNTNFKKGQYSWDRQAQGMNVLQPELYPRVGTTKYRSVRQNAGFHAFGKWFSNHFQTPEGSWEVLQGWPLEVRGRKSRQSWPCLILLNLRKFETIHRYVSDLGRGELKRIYFWTDVFGTLMYKMIINSQKMYMQIGVRKENTVQLSIAFTEEWKQTPLEAVLSSPLSSAATKSIHLILHQLL